jgi:hypothetical protein
MAEGGPLNALQRWHALLNEAIKALEEAGILTWVNRITRIRRRERDLFGAWGSVCQVIRISNGYVFRDPLDRQPGRNRYKSENPTGPPNREKNQDGARLDGAQVTPEEAPPSTAQADGTARNCSPTRARPSG